MILDKKDFALSLTGSPVSLQETTLIETRYSQSRCVAIPETMSVFLG